MATFQGVRLFQTIILGIHVGFRVHSAQATDVLSCSSSPIFGGKSSNVVSCSLMYFSGVPYSWQHMGVITTSATRNKYWANPQPCGVCRVI